MNKDNTVVNAEELWNTFARFYYTPEDDKFSIWGVKYLRDVLAYMSPEEFVSKLREFENKPRSGQIWVSRLGNKIILRCVNQVAVYFYKVPSGDSVRMTLADFLSIYTNTGEVCKSLAPLLDEIAKIEGESNE